MRAGRLCCCYDAQREAWNMGPPLFYEYMLIYR
jgi:hypothetical protein